MEIQRCSWAGDDPLYVEYHDKHWGREIHDDRLLFEMLILETMQAGLSWITILKKRDSFREAFDNFDPYIMAKYDDKKINELMQNDKIIRNRLKITSASANARAFIAVREKYTSFDNFLWKYVDYKPIIGKWEREEDIPANTPLSDKISIDMKKLGFKFIGSTTIYSFIQAVGMVNDHIKDCFVYKTMYPTESDNL